VLFIIRYKISDFGCAGYPAGSWPAFRRVLIELRQGGAGDLPFIIVQVAAEDLVAVQFQMRHDKIGIAHAEIRAGGTSFTLVVAGALSIIDGGDTSLGGFKAEPFKQSTPTAEELEPEYMRIVSGLDLDVGGTDP
jgi:hypothetical protein